MSTFQPRIGEVYWMDFSGSGHEQSGMHPGVIFQNNVGNIHSPCVTVLPITSKLKKLGMPTHVFLRAEDSGLHRDSVVCADCPRTLDKRRVCEYITTLPEDAMKKISVASLLASSSIAFLDAGEIAAAMERAKRLNFLS